MRIRILTLFPEIFPGPLALSNIGRALKTGLWSLEVYNIRDYAVDRHKTVDGPAYGGGGGMVIRADVLGRAIETSFGQSTQPILYMSPRGQVLNQQIARTLARQQELNIVCGRFEGIDERIITEYKLQELSVGDYVLSSGDVAAIVVLDVCLRLLDGVLGNKKGAEEESFGSDPAFQSLLEYPQYTRPPVWKEREVPPVLLSGHHAKIKEWRKEEALSKTRKERPDLLLKSHDIKE